MVVLKCPKCGKLCREGLVPWPRCGRCHERLLKCRYCADFDARMLDCVSTFRSEDFRMRDPDLYLACPHHRTTLEVRPPQRLVRRQVWAGVFLLGVAAVAAMLVLRPRDTASSQPVVHARGVPAPDAVVHEPMVVELQIWNPGPGDVEQVIVALDRSCERYLRLTYVEPTPLAQRRTESARIMWFARLAKGEVLSLRLHVTPTKEGSIHLEADVEVPGSGRREHVALPLDIMP